MRLGDVANYLYPRWFSGTKITQNITMLQTNEHVREKVDLVEVLCIWCIEDDANYVNKKDSAHLTELWSCKSDYSKANLKTINTPTCPEKQISQATAALKHVQMNDQNTLVALTDAPVKPRKWNLNPNREPTQHHCLVSQTSVQLSVTRPLMSTLIRVNIASKMSWSKVGCHKRSSPK